MREPWNFLSTHFPTIYPEAPRFSKMYSLYRETDGFDRLPIREDANIFGYIC
nr:MAG TPA: hypothetical protein [Caudoviricetes sp.]DAW90781.1 MAG TPA: hypothetical protein [Bacteriophage sp.]